MSSKTSPFSSVADPATEALTSMPADQFAGWVIGLREQRVKRVRRRAGWTLLLLTAAVLLVVLL